MPQGVVFHLHRYVGFYKQHDLLLEKNIPDTLQKILPQTAEAKLAGISLSGQKIPL